MWLTLILKCWYFSRRSWQILVSAFLCSSPLACFCPDFVSCICSDFVSCICPDFLFCIFLTLASSWNTLQYPQARFPSLHIFSSLFTCMCHRNALFVFKVTTRQSWKTISGYPGFFAQSSMVLRVFKLYPLVQLCLQEIMLSEFFLSIFSCHSSSIPT